ncbi:capsular polysaccharide export protein, LipB/KpsS family [Ralstonia sp. 25C]|uniref:capsular polysaccharide export protein, LipB/KpsS family n=1 Tax=Ralstonia sp. 25C TaxID=3447363 RepID=UPI003F74E7EB
MVKRILADAEVRFVRSLAKVPLNAAIAVWGNMQFDAAVLGGRRVLRIEDGFLRSVGLGVDLVRPLSLAVDAQGIYYDASQPSDLESILQHANFDAALLARAAKLRTKIVASGITKYNVGTGEWQRPAGHARIVAAVGQVESDAALRDGAPGLRSNLGLLQAVRRTCPDAYIVYKPHPDVLAGLRKGRQDAGEVLHWCDEIVEDVSMDRLIHEVDEVHVLTSLAGFEALLRGRQVTTYGQPFYAGWGLTADALPIDRRTRRLTVDELVAGALILYPRYLCPESGELVSVEQALDALIAWRDTRRAEPYTHTLTRGILLGLKRFGLRALLGKR